MTSNSLCYVSTGWPCFRRNRMPGNLYLLIIFSSSAWGVECAYPGSWDLKSHISVMGRLFREIISKYNPNHFRVPGKHGPTIPGGTQGRSIRLQRQTHRNLYPRHAADSDMYWRLNSCSAEWIAANSGADTDLYRRHAADTDSYSCSS